MNVAALLNGARAVASHPITKGGSLAALISGGLYAAQFAGVAIPSIAFSAGPLAGYILYKLLPKKIEDEIDATAEKFVDIATTIPQTYSQPSDFPNPPPADHAQGQPNSNINQ